MIIPNYIIPGFCLLLLILLVGKEASRANKQRLWLRLLASILAVASLLSLVIPIPMQKEISDTGIRQAVLLTDGYNTDSLKAFTAGQQRAIQVYTEDSLSCIDSNFSVVHIFGNGLKDADLKRLGNSLLVFHPTVIDRGITAIHWPQQLRSGEQLWLQGSCVHKDTVPVKIILSAFGESLDSVMLQANTTNQFSLNAVPKQLGKAIYQIIVVSGKDTLQREPLPVEVIPSKPLKVLVLAASPGFENKFLQDRISLREFGVVTRTRISKEKYDKAFLNTPVFSFNQINQALLSKFDVLVTDADEWAAFTPAERANIQDAAEENGLGLIIQTDSLAPAAYAKEFETYAGVADQPQLWIQLNDAVHSSASLQIEKPLFIRNHPGIQSLITDAAKHTLAAVALQGRGKLVVSTIPNSYSWLLAGNEKMYDAYWYNLLQQAAKRSVPADVISTADVFSIAGFPVSIQVQSNANTFPIVLAGTGAFAFQQNSSLPFQWQSLYWPFISGWQNFNTGSGLKKAIYVFDTSNWRTVRASEKIRHTKQYIEQQRQLPAKSIIQPKYTTTNIPAICFLLIFILCCSFLWIERKIA